ncbi:MAG: radical SAM protein [Candidatus Aureabacteria bacterium]|nr:radical SAM protein [Candidatus Auribacterota bacterium]
MPKITDKKVIDHTRSVCPECLKQYDAEIISEHNQAFMVRTCTTHGVKKHLVSKNADDYEYFRECYLMLKKDINMSPSKQKAYNIHVTDKCNLKCPICYSRGQSRQKDITIKDLEEHFQGVTNSRLCLFGGEPTMHEHVEEIIQWIKKNNNIAVLYTNGLKLDDSEFVKKIKNAGIDEVHIQFDGFSENAYETFRGNKNLLHIKQTAIEECARQNLTIVLEVTVNTNNISEINSIFNFALEKPNIKGVVFRTLCLVDLTSKYEQKITTDDIIHTLSRNKKHPVSEEEINLFQKLLYKYCFYFKVPLFGCVLNRYYLLYKDGNTTLNIGDMLNLKKINSYFSDFHQNSQKRSNKWIAAFKTIFHFLNKRNIKVALLILRNFLTEKFNGRHKHIKPVRSFFFLEISGPMDQYNYDQKIIELCPSGVYLEEKLHRSLGLAYYDRRMNIDKLLLSQEYRQKD